MNSCYLKQIAKIISAMICAVSVAFCITPDCVYASSDYTVMQCFTNKDYISVYVNSSDKKIESADCQIGRLAAEKVEVSLVADKDIPIRTLFLLDNSKSITQQYRPIINDIINQVVDGHLSGEEFRIATIDTDIHYLTDFTSDYELLKKTIESIQYDNQDTYYSDLMYNVLKDLAEEKDSVYLRVVIVSDGADDMSLGVKGTEVVDIAQASNIPVYSLGVKNKNNEERLKNMFEISRKTNALYYSLDEVDVEQVVKGLALDRNNTEIKIYPSEEQLDGKVQSLKLTVNTADGSKDILIDVKMPFGDAASNIATTEAVEESSEDSSDEVSTESTAEEQPVIEKNDDQDIDAESDDSSITMDQVLLAVLAILIGILLLYTLKKKKNPKKEAEKKRNNTKRVTQESASDKISKENIDKSQQEQDDRTVLDSDEMIQPPVEEHKKIGNTRFVTIAKKNDPTSMKRFYADKRIVIGRDKDLNDYSLPTDRKVSSQHCYIEADQSGRVLLYDLNSTNGLVCNGEKVSKQKELSNESTLILGSTELIVNIID